MNSGEMINRTPDPQVLRDCMAFHLFALWDSGANAQTAIRYTAYVAGVPIEKVKAFTREIDFPDGPLWARSAMKGSGRRG